MKLIERHYCIVESPLIPSVIVIFQFLRETYFTSKWPTKINFNLKKVWKKLKNEFKAHLIVELV